MRDLKVMSRVSFCWPQKVPARARRMLRREEARDIMESMWGEKVKWGSKVTPRMRGFSDSGRGVELRVTWGWVWVWWVWGVKRVTVDLGADRESPFCLAHSDTRVVWSVRAEAAVR